jgi:hypothetical protein
MRSLTHGTLATERLAPSVRRTGERPRGSPLARHDRDVTGPGQVPRIAPSLARQPYRFTGTWTVPAPLPGVHDVLADLGRYPQWWPQVVAVARLGPDDARVLCRSVLPYTLDLVLHAVRREPDRLQVAIGGDLLGEAAWWLTAIEGGTRLDFEQRVTVGGWLAVVSPGLRPLLRWNHRRMMAGCLAGLRARACGGVEPHRAG